jgi:hypothetical protein
LYNHTNGLHTVAHMPVAPLPVGHSSISSLDGLGSATSVFYVINIILLLLFSVSFGFKFKLSDYDDMIFSV